MDDEFQNTNKDIEIESSDRMRRKITGLENDLAKLHAQRAALMRALYHFCPNHPILRSTALREAIGQAGYNALQATNDWSATRQAGAQYPVYDEYPVVPSDVQMGRINLIRGSGIHGGNVATLDQGKPVRPADGAANQGASPRMR